ncbi:DUF397 domain-containing protein [Nocardia takedensis]|uniref:DUF397 domain-containing protein n=1 Tax=Nocardia takedensis TaxID=259390 RepID=UPI0002EBC0BE|nr:DUF397 domain-containing protein [Nocardia takedensis]
MTTTATLRSVCPGWFTSSRSNNGNQCVEVRFVGDAVQIRDSKYRRDPANLPADEPIITVTTAEWTAFLTALAADAPTDRPTARPGVDGGTVLRHGDIALTYTPAEWLAFVAGVRDGEFDRVALSV